MVKVSGNSTSRVFAQLTLSGSGSTATLAGLTNNGALMADTGSTLTVTNWHDLGASGNLGHGGEGNGGRFEQGDV